MFKGILFFLAVALSTNGFIQSDTTAQADSGYIKVHFL